MTIVTADFAFGARRGGSGCFNEQVNRRRASQHFDALCTEATSNLQPEGTLIEINRLLEVVYVDIRQELLWGAASIRGGPIRKWIVIQIDVVS
jgi:hypothetical protein